MKNNIIGRLPRFSFIVNAKTKEPQIIPNPFGRWVPTDEIRKALANKSGQELENWVAWVLSEIGRGDEEEFPGREEA